VHDPGVWPLAAATVVPQAEVTEYSPLGMILLILTALLE
jgi:hypothetical protein